MRKRLHVEGRLPRQRVMNDLDAAGVCFKTAQQALITLDDA
jgi:hypothetical protein